MEFVCFFCVELKSLLRPSYFVKIFKGKKKSVVWVLRLTEAMEGIWRAICCEDCEKKGFKERTERRSQK
jgi:hypothetical protein